MKRKRMFFYTRKQWEHHLYFTKNGCMRSKRYKNEITVRYGIKLNPKHRHRRSFICCKLPKVVGNRVVYRLFKATVWYKDPNTKYRREEKYYE